MPSTTILGVRYDALTTDQASDQLAAWAEAGEARYACFSNAHGTIEATDDPAFRDVLNGADLNVPDGMSVVREMRARGVDQRDRVYGPDVALAVAERAAERGLPVAPLRLDAGRARRAPPAAARGGARAPDRVRHLAPVPAAEPGRGRGVRRADPPVGRPRRPRRAGVPAPGAVGRRARPGDGGRVPGRRRRLRLPRGGRCGRRRPGSSGRVWSGPSGWRWSRAGCGAATPASSPGSWWRRPGSARACPGPRGLRPSRSAARPPAPDRRGESAETGRRRPPPRQGQRQPAGAPRAQITPLGRRSPTRRASNRS